MKITAVVCSTDWDTCSNTDTLCTAGTAAHQGYSLSSFSRRQDRKIGSQKYQGAWKLSMHRSSSNHWKMFLKNTQNYTWDAIICMCGQVACSAAALCVLTLTLCTASILWAASVVTRIDWVYTDPALFILSLGWDGTTFGFCRRRDALLLYCLMYIALKFLTLFLNPSV